MNPLVFSLWLLAVRSSVHADQSEMKLLRDLMTNYNRQERPVKNFSQPIKVKMKVLLQQILGLQTKNEELTTNVWLQIEWSDYKLKWAPGQYNNITDTRFPAGQIWQPDILLYNSAETNFESTYPTNLVLYSNGLINWVPPGILKSRCMVDITYFPFDEQRCPLKFGSWTYTSNAVDLEISYQNDSDQKNAMDTSEYITNGEWDLISTPAVKIQQNSSCCRKTPYSYLTFYIRMRRRTWYYGFNLIIPSTLISLMTVLGFTLPPDACEKITLEITILLTVSYLLSVVAAETPVTSITVPLIGTFFNCCLLVVSASVVFTTIVLNLHFRSQDTHEMSEFIRGFLLVWLPWLLMMRRPGVKFTKRLLISKEARDAALAHTTREDYERAAAAAFEDGAPGPSPIHTATPSKEAECDCPSEPDSNQESNATDETTCLDKETRELYDRVNQCAALMFQEGCGFCDM